MPKRKKGSTPEAATVMEPPRPLEGPWLPGPTVKLRNLPPFPDDEFGEFRFVLAPGGVVASNIIGALQGPRSALFRAMYKTFAEVFPGLYPFPVALRPYDDVETIRNIILVATAERGLSREEILRRARALAPRVTYSQFMHYAADYYELPISVADVPVLTDDYAPVDTLVPVYHWTPPRRP
jgi:hypothetical protein